jgi:hypothetical protein
VKYAKLFSSWLSGLINKMMIAQPIVIFLFNYMKYLWRGLAIFNAVFFTYVLVFAYQQEPDELFWESLTKIFSTLYLLFWIPISITLICQSFKK